MLGIITWKDIVSCVLKHLEQDNSRIEVLPSAAFLLHGLYKCTTLKPIFRFAHELLAGQVDDTQCYFSDSACQNTHIATL